MPFNIKGKYGDDGNAKYYEIETPLDVLASFTPDQNWTAELISWDTWGLAFLAGTTGVKTILVVTHDTIAGTSWTAQLITPWGTFNASGLGATTKLYSYVQFDLVTEDINASCNGSLVFNAARWYLQVNGGTKTIQSGATSGPQTYTITGFDLRLDDLILLPSFSTFYSLPSGLENCADKPADQPVWDKELTVSYTNAGWWYSEVGSSGPWTELDVEFQGDVTLPSVVCACPALLPGGAGGMLSHHLDGLTSLYDVITINDFGHGGTTTVPCVDENGNPCGGPLTGYLWTVARQVNVLGSYVNGCIPDAFPITPIQIVEMALCGTSGIPTSLTSTISSPTGQSLLSKSSVTAFGQQACWVKTSGHCNAVVPPHTCGPQYPAGWNVITWCGFTCTRTDSWPTAPPCPAGSHNPKNLEISLGRYWKTYLDSNNDVWVYGSYYTTPVAGWPIQTKVTTSGDCSDPRVLMDHRGVLYVAYSRTGGGYYERESADGGFSFTSEVMSLTGAHHPEVKCSSLGTLFRAGFHYSSGTSGPGYLLGNYQYAGSNSPSSSYHWQSSGLTDIIVQDDTFGIDFAWDQQERLVAELMIYGESDSSSWYSTDYGQTWSRV